MCSREWVANDLIYDPTYLGIDRSDDIVLVQITLSAGRKPPQKRKLFQRMAEILSIMASLVETAWENWSFGSGDAQYIR